MKSDYKKHQRETISPQLRPLITSPKKMAKKLSLYPENGKRKSFFFFLKILRIFNIKSHKGLLTYCHSQSIDFKIK